MEQNNTYSYSCKENKNEIILTSEFSIPKDKTGKLTKLAVFGDWSKGDQGEITFNYLNKNLEKKNYDSILILGDLAYNLYSDNGKTGNDFLEYIIPITSKVPLMVTPGNHEYKFNFEDFKKRFYLPNSKATVSLFYSFDINNVHFISVNTEMLFDDEKYFDKKYLDTFKEWFRKDLYDSSLINYKWKIVYMHRPLYCSKLKNDKCDKEAKIVREFFEDLFYDGNFFLQKK